MPVAQRRNRGTEPATGPRVVVVGGGFGGLSAVAALAHSGARVTLVDRNAYSTFQPLLYQVATAGLAPSDVAYPLRAVTRRDAARFRLGSLASIDLAARLVTLADGSSLDYDYLILATGVSAAFFGITGAAEHCFSLYTRRNAITLRNQLVAELERRSLPGQADGLAITIVGGGATGIELAGTLADLRNIALPAAFPDVSPDRVQIRLIEARRLLAEGVRPAAVAAQCGFADQSHLGRWFRRAYGLSPATYRAGCTGVPDAGAKRP